MDLLGIIAPYNCHLALIGCAVLVEIGGGSIDTSADSLWFCGVGSGSVCEEMEGRCSPGGEAVCTLPVIVVCQVPTGGC